MFSFTEEQRSIQEMVRDYAQKVLKSRAEEIDKTGRYPAESIKELAEMGVMGLNISEEYGGAGMDTVSKVLAIAEVASCCGSTCEIFSTQLLVNDIVQHNASEEQKAKYLPMIAEGKLGAFALTEPNAGSDASGIRTKAVKDGEDYVITGSKCFISNMGPEEGEFVVVIAMTDPEKGTHGGATAFLVPRGTPGFTVGKTEDKLGVRGAAVSELSFDECRVPASAIVGKEGDGFNIAFSGLDGGRISMAAMSVGFARGALDEAIQYSQDRIQFGKSISRNQGIRWYLADMATRTEAAWLLTLRAADAMDRGEPVSKLASMAKYYAGETCSYVVDLALQIHGGYGYMKDYPIERIYRDSRIQRIYEGTSEVQKIVIAKELLR